jgi:hypothetical protein
MDPAHPRFQTEQPGSDSFFGIDRGVDDGTFSALFDAGGPLTAETIEKAAREILEWKPPDPCGSDEKHPHGTAPVDMTLPAERRRPVQCVNCGEWLLYTSEKRGVSLGSAGLFTDALYKAMPPLKLEPEPPRLPYGLNIIASDACPSDTMFLIPTSPLTAEEAAAARALMERGHSEESAVAEVRAKKSAMVRTGGEDV